MKYPSSLNKLILFVYFCATGVCMLDYDSTLVRLYISRVLSQPYFPCDFLAFGFVSQEESKSERGRG